MNHFIFDDYSSVEIEEMRRRFRSAAPFPHLVLDDVLRHSTPSLADAFPDEDWPSWQRFADPYQQHKAYCAELDRMPPRLRDALVELSSPHLLSFLESVTGITGLLPDPYLVGGGLHASGAGGVLAPHTDFHLHTQLNIYRRINLLVYLNPDWDPQDGGALELYADAQAQRSAVQVLPIQGRCVIFQTDHKSVHGFPHPVAPGKRRKSIATYYYTSSEAADFSGDTTTYWRRHESENSAKRSDRVRIRTYKTFITAARAIAGAAHRINPDLSAKREDPGP